MAPAERPLLSLVFHISSCDAKLNADVTEKDVMFIFEAPAETAHSDDVGSFGADREKKR